MPTSATGTDEWGQVLPFARVDACAGAQRGGARNTPGLSGRLQGVDVYAASP